MELEILKTYGYGTAVSNCAPMGVTIHVHVHNLFSLKDNEVKSTPTVMKKSSTDANGKVKSDAILVDQTVEAKWLPSGSNRKTAPNIRVGEQVEVLQQGDSDIFWWRPLGIDENLRRLETIVMAISGSPTDENVTPDGMYWIEFSSHSKKVCLTTSKKNGEKTIYHIGIDPGKGTLTFTDDVGNSLSSDFSTNQWLMVTALGASLELIGKDINIISPGNMDAKVTGNLTVAVDGNTSVVSKGIMHLSGQGSTIDLTAAGIVWKAPTFLGST